MKTRRFTTTWDYWTQVNKRRVSEGPSDLGNCFGLFGLVDFLVWLTMPAYEKGPSSWAHKKSGLMDDGQRSPVLRGPREGPSCRKPKVIKSHREDCTSRPMGRSRWLCQRENRKRRWSNRKRCGTGIACECRLCAATRPTTWGPNLADTTKVSVPLCGVHTAHWATFKMHVYEHLPERWNRNHTLIRKWRKENKCDTYMYHVCTITLWNSLNRTHCLY